MAKFDENKVINGLHPEKAEVGKKYWFSDSITWLKRKVESNEHYSTLKNFESPYFEVVDSESTSNKYFLLYPYEEPPKQRMTNRQLAEWCVKGNGELTTSVSMHVYAYHDYPKGEEDEEVKEAIVIRPFGESKWIEPTVAMYERDCKGE